MGTHRAWGSGKTSSWICIMRSPPGANSVTKQAWLEVWKQARRESRKGCPVQPTASRIRFSQYRLQGGHGFRGKENLCWLCPATHMTPRARWVFSQSATQVGRWFLCIRGSRGSLNLHNHHYPILQMKTLRYRDKRGPAQMQAINNRRYLKENLGLAGPQSHLFKAQEHSAALWYHQPKPALLGTLQGQAPHGVTTHLSISSRLSTSCFFSALMA